MLITLIYGSNFFMFKPDASADHCEYALGILTKQCQFFGPFPVSYQEIARPSTLNILMGIMGSLRGKQKPFANISTEEVSSEDKKFIPKIMKLDPRDRPSAQQLLDDECRILPTGPQSTQDSSSSDAPPCIYLDEAMYKPAPRPPRRRASFVPGLAANHAGNAE
ncbi:kinase-like protein [Penicillium chrysogenum]|nr:kinase-like protein [Penicillium chrysogenum]